MTKRLLALVAAMLLAGCSHIPTSGPVTEVTISDHNRVVQIAPEPPQDGMSASRVVEGFLQAMADPTGNYAVARQYLTTEVQQAWDPSGSTLVYDGWVEETDGAFELRGTARGSLDEVGHFQTIRQEILHDFAVVEENGQWRISSPPPGILVSSFIFGRSYTTVKSYYLTTQGQAVIPDMLRVPQSDLTPTRIITAQLAGPGSSLSGAVRSAIPDGVGLGAGGATVDSNGVATVDLTGLPVTLNDEARRELGAQLLWSLSSIPRVTALKITSDGDAYPLPGQNDKQVLELSSQQGFQPLSRAGSADLYGVRDSLPGRLSLDGSFMPNNSEPGPVTMMAVSLDGELVAYVNGDPAIVSIGPNDGALVTVDTGLTGVRSVQFAQNRLWLQGIADDGQERIVNISSQGAIAGADISGLPGTVVAFSVDPSGVRMAAIVEKDGTRMFGTAVLTENSQVSGWREVSLTTTSAPLELTALDWTGELDVALVARTDSAPSVFIVSSDGSEITDIGPVSSTPVQITALPRPGGDALAVRSDSGTVLLYQPNGAWRLAPATMSWISYPG